MRTAPGGRIKVAMIQADELRSEAELPRADAPTASVRMHLRQRVFDVAVATLCLMLASPLMAGVAIVIRLTTPGPALFRQVRLGQGQRQFVLYKFRTMHAGSDDDVHREYVRGLLTLDRPPTGGQRGLYKLEDDARITRVGRLLRRTSIDELPQLFNVIRGDMSLVGPRPVLPWEAELIGAAHARRYRVRPGTHRAVAGQREEQPHHEART